MLFDVYDIDGTGEVGVQELLHFVARESQELLNAAQFTKELFYNVLDRNTDGVVTQDEFLEALLMDPVMYDCFAKSLVAGIVRAPAAVCVCVCHGVWVCLLLLPVLSAAACLQPGKRRRPLERLVSTAGAEAESQGRSLDLAMLREVWQRASVALSPKSKSATPKGDAAVRKTAKGEVGMQRDQFMAFMLDVFGSKPGS